MTKKTLVSMMLWAMASSVFTVLGSDGQNTVNSYINRECADSATLDVDSINIPVFLVDGVEGNIRNVSPDDIIKVEIIKDSSITRIFRPRLGGIVLITTKSKKFLKSALQENQVNTDSLAQNRIPGQLMIR